MCPNVADQADSGTKGSVAVRTWNSSNDRRACFGSTGFAEQSLSFCLAYRGLFIGLRSLPDQAALLASNAFSEDLRGLHDICVDRQYTSSPLTVLHIAGALVTFHRSFLQHGQPIEVELSSVGHACFCSPASLRTSGSGIMFCHVMRSNLRRHLIYDLFSFLACLQYVSEV